MRRQASGGAQPELGDRAYANLESIELKLTQFKQSVALGAKGRSDPLCTIPLLSKGGSAIGSSHKFAFVT